MIMDDQLETLQEEAENKNILLEPTMYGLENLEKLFFEITKTSDEEKKQGWIVTFARYLGEIVRTTYYGKWHLSLDDPKNLYYNTAVIVNHNKVEGLEFSPICAMRALSIRKKNGLLRKIVMADIKPRELEIDHLEEK